MLEKTDLLPEKIRDRLESIDKSIIAVGWGLGLVAFMIALSLWAIVDKIGQ